LEQQNERIARQRRKRTTRRGMGRMERMRWRGRRSWWVKARREGSRQNLRAWGRRIPRWTILTSTMVMRKERQMRRA